jgi:hypothetical protein
MSSFDTEVVVSVTGCVSCVEHWGQAISCGPSGVIDNFRPLLVACTCDGEATGLADAGELLSLV